MYTSVQTDVCVGYNVSFLELEVANASKKRRMKGESNGPTEYKFSNMFLPQSVYVRDVLGSGTPIAWRRGDNIST
jgi:hypothetical protein